MTTGPAQVVVYWRPGCPYCRRLRRGLDRIGLATREVNIWEDPDAAATVRAIASGNETVPTVVVGPITMVNPAAAQVVATVRVHAPDLFAGIDAAAAPADLGNHRRSAGHRLFRIRRPAHRFDEEK